MINRDHQNYWQFIRPNVRPDQAERPTFAESKIGITKPGDKQNRSKKRSKVKTSSRKKHNAKRALNESIKDLIMT